MRNVYWSFAGCAHQDLSVLIEKGQRLEEFTMSKTILVQLNVHLDLILPLTPREKFIRVTSAMDAG